MPFCGSPTVSEDDAVITTGHPSGLLRGTYYYQFTSVTDYDVEADTIENKLITYGNGTPGPYFKTLSMPIKPGTLTITDGVETFMDDSAGVLIGDKGGSGSVNYNGGDIALTFNDPTEFAIMAFYTVIIYVAVTIAAVLYSGGLTLHTIFGIDLTTAVWIIGIIAAFYTTYGGLRAVVWADLIQGSALIIGGVLTMILGFIAVGGVSNFLQANADRLHMILPSDHIEIP